MRKLERRAVICMLLSLFLLLGLIVFCFQFVTKGSEWVSFPSNQHLFADGRLDSGTVYDVDGTMLLKNGEGGTAYADDGMVRRATLHVVGDPVGNIATGAETKFAGKLTGYNFINGAYSLKGEGHHLYLTIDADVCCTAYRALDGRKGCVGVYNYKTGEIICAVSSPSYDPNDPVSEATAEDGGYYINRLFSATFVPGSIFKTVTSAAVIENLDYENWHFQCTGSTHIGDSNITCVSAHGDIGFEDALCQSCNGAFATLTTELGAETMEGYVDKLGLTKAYSINGIRTAKGTFSFPEDNDAALGWSGAGQYEDMVNPCSMMIYMGAVANNGRVVLPQLVGKVKSSDDFPLSVYIPRPRLRLVTSDTASVLKGMLRNNVINNYGEGNFPGLNLCAKSGTAEVGDGTSHSWFTGFLDDDDHPYAFIVLVEHGGGGAKVAGPIANRVLQSVLENE